MKVHAWFCSGRALFVSPRSFFAALLLSLLFLLAPLGAQGQALSGIQGTVIDESEGTVPDAKVTVTNNATGVVSSAVTTSAGTYTITDLIPGTYTVTIA